ncbi:MAG: type II secretion system protein GspH, partial [Betaproteobacteria bacterium]|nr:type II secretion system protein GspH [Betaproteobacteria bacterium]
MWVTGRFRPPLSFASRPKRASWLCACRGFSLIEVLVVLVLLGIVMSFASLSLRGLQGRGLALEAERLGARIQVAQQEASLLAQPIRLELDDRGYRFYRNQLGRWLLIEGDDILYIARSATTQRLISVDLSVGGRLPAYCTSMGRILLAALDDASLQDYLDHA